MEGVPGFVEQGVDIGGLADGVAEDERAVNGLVTGAERAGAFAFAVDEIYQPLDAQMVSK